MAKVTKTKTVTRYTLELEEEEAMAVAVLVGNISGHGKFREITDRVWGAFDEAEQDRLIESGSFQALARLRRDGK